MGTKNRLSNERAVTPAQIMARAAQLLDEDAQAGFESCQIGERAWTCTDCSRLEGRCLAQIAHDDRRRIAAALIVMAKAL